MSRKAVWWTGLGLFLLGLLVACGRPRKSVYRHLVMGTVCELTFFSPSAGDPDEISREVFARLDRLEDLWSPYKEGSEIFALNRDGAVTASPETASLFREAVEIGRLTGGAFDITIKPALDALREAARRDEAPNMEAALALVDYRKLDVAEDGVIRFSRDGMAADPGGLGKGLAVDEAVALLRERGVPAGIVNLGGDLYAFGRGPHRGRWRVGLQDPEREGLLGVLLVTDRAVATSGDYRRFYELDDKRYSHILDPRRGLIKVTTRSITVTAERAVIADGLATALGVLEAEEGIRLAEKLDGVEALIVTAEGQHLATSAFELTR